MLDIFASLRWPSDSSRRLGLAERSGGHSAVGCGGQTHEGGRLLRPFGCTQPCLCAIIDVLSLHEPTGSFFI